MDAGAPAAQAKEAEEVEEAPHTPTGQKPSKVKPTSTAKRLRDPAAKAQLKAFLDELDGRGMGSISGYVTQARDTARNSETKDADAYLRRTIATLRRPIEALLAHVPVDLVVTNQCSDRTTARLYAQRTDAFSEADAHAVATHAATIIRGLDTDYQRMGYRVSGVVLGAGSSKDMPAADAQHPECWVRKDWTRILDRADSYVYNVTEDNETDKTAGALQLWATNIHAGVAAVDCLPLVVVWAGPGTTPTTFETLVGEALMEQVGLDPSLVVRTTTGHREGGVSASPGTKATARTGTPTIVPARAPPAKGVGALYVALLVLPEADAQTAYDHWMGTMGRRVQLAQQAFRRLTVLGIPIPDELSALLPPVAPAPPVPPAAAGAGADEDDLAAGLGALGLEE